MHFAKTIFLLLHVASVLGMLVLLLMQTSKAEKVLPKGFMHAALTALVAGFAGASAGQALPQSGASQLRWGTAIDQGLASRRGGGFAARPSATRGHGHLVTHVATTGLHHDLGCALGHAN